MIRLRDWAYAEPWLNQLASRVTQVMWILRHEADIDADFLAIYGIDLYEQEVDGPRYFALAHRLTAYQGVMAVRAEAEREEEPDSSTPTRTSSTAPPARQGASESAEVSLTQFRAQFPGLVSVGGSEGGG